MTVVVLTVSGCTQTESEEPPPRQASQRAPDHVERVVFPDALHVDHEPVNVFIEKALTICARGDYESFRLLWSARQDPLRREEFEQGWQAVRTIRVRAVEKIVLPGADGGGADPRHSTPPNGVAPDVSYVLLAEAEFDPNHPLGQRQPVRDFVLLVLQEQGEWRLGRAPAAVREWIKARSSAQQDRDAEASLPVRTTAPRR